MAIMRGDRFVLRDETAQRTIGGGVVLHPWAARDRCARAATRGRSCAARPPPR
jgi:hypothetical protein